MLKYSDLEEDSSMLEAEIDEVRSKAKYAYGNQKDVHEAIHNRKKCFKRS